MISCSLTIGSADPQHSIKPEFATWLAEHEKSYSSLKELQKREDIFFSNVKRIHSLNQEYRTR